VLYSGLDTASGLVTNVDYLLVIKTFESQILGSRKKWSAAVNMASGKAFTISFYPLTY
jgi:hypothetical protein